MKKILAVAAVLVVAGLIGRAVAQDTQPAPKKPHPMYGKIVSVGTDGKVTVHVKHGDMEKDVVIATDAQTKVTVDKNPAKVADLKAGLWVRIVGEKDKVAVEIDASTKEPTRHHGGDAPPAPTPPPGN